MSKNTPNHYKTLDIPHDASFQQIRRAYLQRMKSVHPDRIDRKTDPERWKKANETAAKINHAYGVLKDPKTKAQYDLEIGNQTRDSSNVANDSTYASDFYDVLSNIRAGNFSYFGLPESARSLLLRRQGGNCWNQVKINLGDVNNNYISAIALSMWYVFVIMAATVSSWSVTTAVIFIAITTVITSLLFKNI